jgi:hypothetical protein
MPSVVSSAVNRGRNLLGRRGSALTDADYVEMDDIDEYTLTDSMLPDSTDVAVFTDSLSMLPRTRSTRRQSSNLMAPISAGENIHVLRY